MESQILTKIDVTSKDQTFIFFPLSHSFVNYTAIKLVKKKKSWSSSGLHMSAVAQVERQLRLI